MSIQHQPTILVKKSDGTSERIPLEEFRARKSGKASVDPVPAAPAPVVTPTTVLSAEPILVQKSEIPQQKKLSVSDLLSELSKHQLPARANSDQYDLKSELQKSGKIPSVKLIPQAESKNIESVYSNSSPVAEVMKKNHVLQPVKKLEKKEFFSEPLQAKNSQSVETIHSPNWEKSDHGSLLDEPLEMEPAAAAPIGPKVPVSSNSVVQASAPEKNQADPIARLAKKPVIHDIMPMQRSSHAPVGPVEEIAQFDLKQFRALGHSVEEARELFFQKFSLLKKESYLLYMDAKKAWYQSPLFLQYRNITITALSSHQPLKFFIGIDPKGVDMLQEEFDAFVWINNQLTYS